MTAETDKECQLFGKLLGYFGFSVDIFHLLFIMDSDYRKRSGSMSKPLSGVKVVELATFVAGPVTGRLLADLGAEVIKVERPDGDAWRITGVSYKPDRFSDDENPVFDIYNAGKKHIALNLKSGEGMEAFHKLLAEADVFVTNTRPKALKRLGLSYEDLKERYPGLIYAILLGYGEEGPDRKSVV